MMDCMKYESDDEGVLLNNNVGLGFVRLSIIDFCSRTPTHARQKAVDMYWCLMVKYIIYRNT